MTSKTEICNMALTHIATKNRIANIETDKSTEATICKVYYDTALKFVLTDVEWGFATARVYLAELSEESPVDWDYAYAYPSDCIKMREVFDSTRRTGVVKVPTEIGLNADRTIKTIFTDTIQAQARYTTSVTDPNLFSPSFVMAFSWYLAYLIAFALTKKKTVRDFAKAEYTEFMQIASVNDAEEDVEDDLPESESIRSRS